MQQLYVAWNAIKFGGAMVYPLLALGVLAIAIILDRSVLYARCLRLPSELANLVETFGFSWVELEKRLDELGPRNAYGRFLQVIADNRTKPAWWVESRAGDEAGRIEKTLTRGLWVLETIVTGAPLLGLLGTVMALFAFNLFSRMQSHALDTMERLGSRLVDHIRLDQEGGESLANRRQPVAAGSAALR